MTGTADKRWVNCAWCGVDLPLRLDGRVPIHSVGKMTVSPLDIPECEGSAVPFNNDVPVTSSATSAEVKDG